MIKKTTGLYKNWQRESSVTLWLSAYSEILSGFPLGPKETLYSQHKPDEGRFAFKAHSNVSAEPPSQAVKGCQRLSNV